jgi:hypothetical protein
VRAAVVIALAVLAALPAGASGGVVAERLVAVGPVFDGDAVTWGEGGRGADLSIHTLRPDGSIVERWRKRADTRRRHTLMWGQFPGVFAASPTWLAFYTFDEEILEAEGDSITSTSTDTMWAGRDGAPPQPLTGKVGPKGCRYEPEVTSVAVDGPRLAWAESRVACARRVWVPRVTVRDASGDRVFRLRPGRRNVRRVRLAGDYVAWGLSEQGTTYAIVVRDLVRNRTVLRVRRPRRVRHHFGDFDLLPDGSVVAIAGSRRASRGFSSVVTASPRRPRLRVLARDAFGTHVEAAGGHAAYIRSRDYSTDGIVLVPLSDPRAAQTVATWTREQQLAGSTFDWDGRRLVYALADVPEPDDVPPDARGRVIVEELAP